MSTPSISFVMPVHNGARYLRQTLASLRWQTFADWEAVCVNDGSTDDTLAILKDFAAVDPRFRIINVPNQGIVGALNIGVMEARAEWIARIDSDDVALPKRLAIQWRFVQDNPDVVVVGSNMLFTDPDGYPIRTEFYPPTHEAIEQALLNDAGGNLGHPSVLMSREAVIQAGLYRKEFEWVEDMDLWIRLAKLGRMANISLTLVHYRQHEQSVCWNQCALQHERKFRMLARARAERGISVPIDLGPPTGPRKQTAAAGKWARRAARVGNYRTAYRQWRKLAAAEPFSFLTFRVTLESVIRAIGALFRRREKHTPLPDWRAWDAPSEPTRRAA